MNDASAYEAAIPREQHPRSRGWLRDKEATALHRELYARRGDVRAYLTLEYVCEHVGLCAPCGIVTHPTDIHFGFEGRPPWSACRGVRFWIEVTGDATGEMFSRMVVDVLNFNRPAVIAAADRATRVATAGRYGVSEAHDNAAAARSVSWLELDRTLHSLEAFLDAAGRTLGMDILGNCGGNYDPRTFFAPASDGNPGSLALLCSPLLHVERYGLLPRPGRHMDCVQLSYASYQRPRNYGPITYSFPCPHYTFVVPSDSLAPPLFHQFANPFTQDVMPRTTVLARLLSAEGGQVLEGLHEALAEWLEGGADGGEGLALPPLASAWELGVIAAAADPGLRAEETIAALAADDDARTARMAAATPADRGAANAARAINWLVAAREARDLAIAADRYAAAAAAAAVTLPLNLTIHTMDYGPERHVLENNRRLIATAWSVYLESGDTGALMVRPRARARAPRPPRATAAPRCRRRFVCAACSRPSRTS